MTRQTSLFVVSLLVLAVSAAVVILLIPSLLSSGEQVSAWAVGVPAFLAAVSAAGMWHWRPPTSI